MGRILREERERRALSLDDLERQTKISRKSLEALEDDNPAALGGTFYFRSFAKQAAGALKLDQGMPEWREAFASIPALSVSPRQASLQHPYVPRVAPLRARREGAWRVASPVLSFVAVLMACCGLYTLADRKIAGDTQPIATVGQDGFRQPILLEIGAVERTWLSIDTDGKHIYSGLLDAADTKELEGKVTARIRTGNAGGLTVIFNGKELGTLGERGQVRTVVFTPDRYQILAPNLTSRLQLLPAVTLP